MSNKYEKEYKVNWMSNHIGNKVTEFNVETVERQLGLFNNSFDVDVTIKGTCFYPKLYVDYVQKAEYTKTIDGELVAIVEFTPVFDQSLRFWYNNDKRFETHFKHTINSYEYGTLVYIFRCGDFEKKIYIDSSF